MVDPQYVIDLDTREVYAARCRRNRCAHCLPINARRRALAISFVEPSRMIRFSLMASQDAEDAMGVARVRMKRLRQALGRMGVPAGQWSWTLERNPKGTGFHAHAVQRGPYIAQGKLQVACQRAGAGQPDIRQIKGRRSTVARYGLKGFGAAGYGLKTFRSDDSAMDSLALNHGRLEHHTPRFFDVNGEKMGVRDVENLAIEALYPSPRHTYMVVNGRTALYYMSPEGHQYLPRPATR
jgi:hypothetical protein